MDPWKIIKTVKKENHHYIISGLLEPPMYNFIHNPYYKEIQLLEMPDGIFDFEGYIDPGEAFYKFLCASSPIMVIFEETTIEDDVLRNKELFNQFYKAGLGCRTLMGIRKRNLRELKKGPVVFTPVYSFCVLLFDNNEDKAIDFALSFMHETKRTQSFLTSRKLSTFHIKIERDP